VKQERPELYFPRDVEWREWLHLNFNQHPKGVDLIFYKLDTNTPSMRWEEAVKVALCYGWIDSTVKSLGNGKRKQYFCPRNPKSNWSKVNKTYIESLSKAGLIHTSGWAMIELAKEKGTWSAMDDVENGVVPPALQNALEEFPEALANFQNFAPSYRKGYLSWLQNAKRPETKEKRIRAIIDFCLANKKSRN